MNACLHSVSKLIRKSKHVFSIYFQVGKFKFPDRMLRCVRFLTNIVKHLNSGHFVR